MIPTPMALYLNQQLYGQILSYGYETPWASGLFEAADPRAGLRLIQICTFYTDLEDWPDLDCPAAEDQRWENTLIEYGLTQADLDFYNTATWLIQAADLQEYTLPAPPVFDAQGFMTWRW